MKVIVSELEVLRTYLTREFYYVMSELITRFGWSHIETWKFWNGAGSLQDRFFDEFGEMPETILFWEGYEFLNEHAQQVQRLPCRKVILADDLHWWDESMRQRKLVGFALCDIVLATYGYTWDNFYPEFAGTKKVVWIPHSASPDFMLPYNSCPENSILLSGAIGRYYPLREQMKILCEQGSYSIAYHGHPGYYTGYDYETNEDIGRSYAETINRYRAGFTDSLIYKYVVAKYFEIPATGSLLFTDEAVSGLLNELGFVENVHYLPVSAATLEEKVQYILDPTNHEELDEIRRRGQEVVWKKHKTSDRARQIDQVCGDVG